MPNNHLTPTPVMGVGVFIATPTFHAPFTAYTWSLARTTAYLTRMGIPFQLSIPDDVKNVDDGRNELVKEFLAGNCTDILFIDADMRWEPSAVTRILTWDEDVVAGAYRYKSDSGTYPVGRIFSADEKTGLLSVSYAPTGFMRIRRRVFEKLDATQNHVGGTAFFFLRQFNGNTYDGGDVSFCRKWIAAGGEVKVDTDIFFGHVGIKHWSGKFADYLAKPENMAKHTEKKSDANRTTQAENAPSLDDPLDVAIETIKLGLADEDSFKVLADIYGNKPWALTADGLETIWRMASNLEPGQLILELGSGISTVVLAIAAQTVGAELISFEENLEFAKKTNALLVKHGLSAEIQVRRIVDNWYDTRELPGRPADLLIFDGQKRSTSGGRILSKPFTIPGLVGGTAAVFFDDASVDRLINVTGGFADIEGGGKPMVVGRLGEEAKKAMGQGGA
ncbi:MAG: protein N-lysine methyltransferase family protein [Gemmatimonadaceae bacterium]|nr:protein N-lysine methyltransferase family protein [Gemmatimonadaceae bacterium]